MHEDAGKGAGAPPWRLRVPLLEALEQGPADDETKFHLAANPLLVDDYTGFVLRNSYIADCQNPEVESLSTCVTESS